MGHQGEPASVRHLGHGGSASVQPVHDWRPDVLGDGFQALTLGLDDDDEGPVVATLVRYSPPVPRPGRSGRVVLYLHGWSDYFFQTGLAQFWAGQGAAFYALDLRKYGRSLRPHQTPTYTDDLAVYDDDLDAALAVVEAEHANNSVLDRVEIP